MKRRGPIFLGSDKIYYVNYAVSYPSLIHFQIANLQVKRAGRECSYRRNGAISTRWHFADLPEANLHKPLKQRRKEVQANLPCPLQRWLLLW